MGGPHLPTSRVSALSDTLRLIILFFDAVYGTHEAHHLIQVVAHAKCGPQGIYPDILHICDLQMIPDAVASALFELVQGGNKKQRLEELRIDYEKWCVENRFTISPLVVLQPFVFPPNSWFLESIQSKLETCNFEFSGFQPRCSTCCPCEQETIHFGCHHPNNNCLCPHFPEDPERCCGSDDCFLDGPDPGENRFSTRCICP